MKVHVMTISMEQRQGYQEFKARLTTEEVQNQTIVQRPCLKITNKKCKTY